MHMNLCMVCAHAARSQRRVPDTPEAGVRVMNCLM